MSRWIQRILIVAGLGVVLWAVTRRLRADEPAPGAGPAAWPPLRMAESPGAEPAPADAGSVESVDGSCPASHPIKGKNASGIYHSPGGRFYDRTNADRCYADGAAAEADGLRRAKR